jgi:hypothetical protein
MNNLDSSQHSFSVDDLRITLSAQNIAVLIGLRNLRIPVERLVCLEEITDQNRGTIIMLEKWLSKNNYPRLLFSANGRSEKPSSLCAHLLRSWNWSEKECELVLKFEGLSASSNPQ